MTDLLPSPLFIDANGDAEPDKVGGLCVQFRTSLCEKCAARDCPAEGTLGVHAVA